ncbi:hypothetical protein NOJ28_15765 [Neorhizobium galegae]|nr:hypothetical protein [Neorhizobium galegae]MCQ1766995.1 hypothetical protein [Neorhizobium galegae]MCQ1849038.1 hypothetical protein [Neorhizobium galegae]
MKIRPRSAAGPSPAASGRLADRTGQDHRSVGRRIRTQQLELGLLFGLPDERIAGAEKHGGDAQPVFIDEASFIGKASSSALPKMKNVLPSSPLPLL